MPLIYLLIGICFEIVAVSFLKACEEFTLLVPSVFVVLGYAAALFFLSLSLRGFPIGIAYAIWSGLGIVSISIVGFVLYGQKLDLPAILGVALIVIGTLVINVFSKSMLR